jgi:hypothetical protein
MATPYTRVTLEVKDSGNPALELPFNFRYEEPNPQKRFNITQGCGSTIIQESKVCRVLPGTIVPFTMVGCGEDYKFFKDLYNLCDENGGSAVFIWTGYWREVWEVKFYSLDNGKPTGRLFTFGGSFIILCEVEEPDFVNPYHPTNPY